jgi:hypothetical protein
MPYCLLVLISLRGCANSRAKVQQEGSGELKKFNSLIIYLVAKEMVHDYALSLGVKQLWPENYHFSSSNTMVSAVGAIPPLSMSLLHNA